MLEKQGERDLGENRGGKREDEIEGEKRLVVAAFPPPGNISNCNERRIRLRSRRTFLSAQFSSSSSSVDAVSATSSISHRGD